MKDDLTSYLSGMSNKAMEQDKRMSQLIVENDQKMMQLMDMMTKLTSSMHTMIPAPGSGASAVGVSTSTGGVIPDEIQSTDSTS
eukprot:11252593-Ditylum_brightwellii.AAC.1